MTDHRTHILFLIDILWGVGGAEGALMRAVRLLPEDRYRCSIGTFRLRPGLALLKDCPCPVHEFPIQRAFSAGALRQAMRLRRFIRAERVDIVQTFFQAADLLGGAVSKLSGRPLLISSRRDMGILLSPKHRFAYRLLGGMFDQVQTVSSAVREHTIRTGGLDPARVVAIPNGIEVERLAAAERDDGLRESLAPGGGPVVLTIGNVRRVKGFDVLIRAAARVVARHPSAVFLIAGSVHEVDYMRELETAVSELGLKRNVKFLGKTDRAPALLKACDIFCLPSRSEGMSNALLEAMACSRPSVVTRVGGNPEVIEDGLTGFLVDNEDHAALGDRILMLLDDSERARHIGEAARGVVEQRFSAQGMVAEMAKMYERLMEARRAGRSTAIHAGTPARATAGSAKG